MPSQSLVSEFSLKRGSPAKICYPVSQDAQALTDFINTFSQENSFTRFAGEQMTLTEEQAYLDSEISKINTGDAVKLFCFVDEQLAGVCDIRRDTSLLTRKRHTGIFGIIIAKEFRGEGIGQKLMAATIAEATMRMPGLKLIKLSCFANNTPAMSLYSKVGFTEVGRLPKGLLYRDEYVDEVIMVKELNDR